MEKINLTITDQEGRIDVVVTNSVEQLSRSRVKDLILEKNILVNGQATKVKYKVLPGDEISITIPDPKELDASPEDIPLDIVFEDDQVIVVNKPQGMVVHPSAGHESGTLVNGLLFHTKLAANGTTFRPGIVHRIDKDTSGLLMVAKTDVARQSLEKQLKEKSNKREYLAIVHGNFKEQTGTINAPIARNKLDRKKQAVDADGKKAITHFEVLESFNGYSLIKCILETGRTHQIRVHLAYINHPVAGDPLYGPKKTLKGNGQFLHAQTLGFVHPTTNEYMEFSIEPPKIFIDTLQKLRHQVD